MQPGPALTPSSGAGRPGLPRRPGCRKKDPVGKVLAGITIPVDGVTTGPGGPGRGLGVGGERPHHWVSGRPWSYDPPSTGR